MSLREFLMKNELESIEFFAKLDMSKKILENIKIIRD